MKISEFSLIEDEVRVFRKNKTFIQSGLGNKNLRKRFTLPVHSLKNYGPLNGKHSPKFTQQVSPEYQRWLAVRFILAWTFVTYVNYYFKNKFYLIIQQ